MIRVFLADDEAPARERLKELLQDIAGEVPTTVAGEAGNGIEALERLPASGAQVLLLDIRMPGMDGIAATRELQRAARPPKVVILTTFDHDEHVYDALRAGATGFLLKTTPPARLVEAVRAAADGESLLSPEIAQRLAERFAHGPRPAPDGVPPELEELTPREREVLRLIARGLTNTDIAAELVTSMATVKTHVNRIFRKLGVAERAQAVVLAYESGFVNPSRRPARSGR
jgi:DNA-binding NarL/FixJ family response regulator